MESHETGFPPFPHSLEIPSGFPHSHGLDDWIYVFSCPLNSNHRHRKGLVTDVSGPQRNACPGTLTPERGLASLLVRAAHGICWFRVLLRGCFVNSYPVWHTRFGVKRDTMDEHEGSEGSEQDADKTFEEFMKKPTILPVDLTITLTNFLGRLCTGA